MENSIIFFGSSLTEYFFSISFILITSNQKLSQVAQYFIIKKKFGIFQMEFIAGHRVAPPPFINPQKKSIFFATFPNMFLLLSVLVFLSWTILDTYLHDVLV